MPESKKPKEEAPPLPAVKPESVTLDDVLHVRYFLMTDRLCSSMVEDESTGDLRRCGQKWDTVRVLTTKDSRQLIAVMCSDCAAIEAVGINKHGLEPMRDGEVLGNPKYLGHTKKKKGKRGSKRRGISNVHGMPIPRRG